MTAANQSKLKWGRRTVLAGAIAVMGLAGAASAFARPELVDLRVVDRETGQVLRTWRHDGRLFVAGEPGARYALRVTNHTGGRVMVVLSVDGVNIVTGETANYDQNGYVLDPWGVYDLNGWRKSRTEVAAFQFAPLPQSYAARTGRPDDVGVIGMAVFKERALLPPPPPVTRAPGWWRDRSALKSEPYGAAADAAAAPPPPPAPVAGFLAGPLAKSAPAPSDAARASTMAQNQASAEGYAAMPRDEKLGTGHGAREWSVSDYTDFVRATPYPQSIRRIEYDTYDNLVASGVIAPSPYAQRRPRPFPGSRDEPGFVPDPPAEP